MIYKIDLKTGKVINNTNVLIEAADEKEALSIFKKQRVHESGISKKDYIASLHISLFNSHETEFNHLVV